MTTIFSGKISPKGGGTHRAVALRGMHICGMRRWVWLGIGIFFGLFAKAQPVGPGLAIRWAVEPGLQQHTEDLFTAAIHPAAAAALSTWSIGIRAERFSWDGSPLAAGVYVAVPVHKGGLSVGFATQGIMGYRSWNAHAGHALVVADWARIGLRIGYQRQAATGYTAKGRWQADAGALLKLTENLWADIACWNLAGWWTSPKAAVPVARLFRSGITWLPSGKTGLSVSLSGGEGLPAAVQGTLWYLIDPALHARLVYTTAHQGIAIGLEYRAGRFRAGFFFGYMFPIGMLGMPSVQYTGQTVE